MLAEGQVETYQQAELAVTLMSMKFALDEAITAVHDCTTIDTAIAYLQQDCELCAGKYTMKEVQVIPQDVFLCLMFYCLDGINA